MIPEEIQDIVQKLLERSRAREVNWVSSSDVGVTQVKGGEDFTVALPNYSVNVWKSHQDPAVRLAFYDDRGRTIMRAVTTPRDDNHPLMEELLELARRKALNVEGALDALRVALAQPGVIGEVKGSEGPASEEEIPF